MLGEKVCNRSQLEKTRQEWGDYGPLDRSAAHHRRALLPAHYEEQKEGTKDWPAGAPVTEHATRGSASWHNGGNEADLNRRQPQQGPRAVSRKKNISPMNKLRSWKVFPFLHVQLPAPLVGSRKNPAAS